MDWYNNVSLKRAILTDTFFWKIRERWLKEKQKEFSGVCKLIPYE